MILILLAAFLLHPAHETLAEVEWNGKTNRLEIALRLDALDEQWLAKAAKPDALQAKWAIAYLTANFQVGDEPTFDTKPTQAIIHRPKRPKYHWIGRKTEGAHVWWYFEIEPTGQKRPTWIRQRMFLERDQRYTNRVIVLGQSPRRVIMLTAAAPIARLDSLEYETSAESIESTIRVEPQEPKS